MAYLAEVFTCPDTGVMDISDPRAYAAKQRGGDADNPTFQQAMNGPAVEEYITHQGTHFCGLQIMPW